MTPKEKAKELADKIYEIENNSKIFRINYTIAKQCALIAVDEIIDLDIDANVLDYWYWQEVKNRIQTL